MVLRGTTRGDTSSKYGSEWSAIGLQNSPRTDSGFPRVNFWNVTFGQIHTWHSLEMMNITGKNYWSFISRIFYFRYPGILLVAVACLAVRARGVRDNNREAAFIGLAVGLSLPIWISSAIGSTVASSESDKEAWLAYGLLTTSFLVFLTMFLPKGRQLAALGREGPTTVIRDRDDALSSLPGSGYSPSFFHFKPAETSLKRKMHYHSAGTLK